MIRGLVFRLFTTRNKIPLRYFCSQKVNKQTKQNPNINKQQKEPDENEQDQSQIKEQNTRNKKKMAINLLFWGCFGYTLYLTYKISQHNKTTPVEDQPWATFGFIQASKTIYNGYKFCQEYLLQPPVKKLLPNELHPEMQPKTLVLNLSGTLLTTKYVFGQGLAVNKRPGVQKFLKKMSKFYQIVIFSNDDSVLIQTLLPHLDSRFQIISGYFGQECMTLYNKKFVKDLRYLNRDLKKIVVIDKVKNVGRDQQKNVITLSQYSGDQKDDQLFVLGILLEDLAKPDVSDVGKRIHELGENPLNKYREKAYKRKQKNEHKSSWLGENFFKLFEEKK